MFGKPSKPSATDLLIEQLTSERDHLREQVAILQRQLVALSDRAADRQLHPPPAAEPQPKREEDRSVYERRNRPFIPEWESARLERMARGEFTS